MIITLDSGFDAERINVNNLERCFVKHFVDPEI